MPQQVVEEPHTDFGRRSQGRSFGNQNTPWDASLPGDFALDRHAKTLQTQAHSGSGWVAWARSNPGRLRHREAEPLGKPALPVAGVPCLPNLILDPSASRAIHRGILPETTLGAGRHLVGIDCKIA
jgi:hypothetical protein